MNKYFVMFVDQKNRTITVEADSVACLDGIYRFKKGEDKVAYVNEDRVLYVKKIEE